ncbi:hypothetical protein VTJ04DRAFT_993 [Mycothermus thermophilus]|uniref:uncharacterized protein n=1 Tax=Humicola insolens TaxID=85995 RepID=UPI0037429CAF
MQTCSCQESQVSEAETGETEGIRKDNDRARQGKTGKAHGPQAGGASEARASRRASTEAGPAERSERSGLVFDKRRRQAAGQSHLADWDWSVRNCGGEQ